MGKEFFTRIVEVGTKVSGKKTRKMGKEFFILKTKVGKKDSIRMGLTMERPYTIMLMVEWKNEFMKKEILSWKMK